MSSFILKGRYSSLIFKNRILNASGCWCTTKKELEDLEKSNCGGIVSKSCLYEKYEGNPQPRTYFSENVSLNSVGLANEGYQFYDSLNFSKPYIISIGVKNIELTFQMLRMIKHEFIELNISCPNIIPNNVSSNKILGYDPESLDEFLKKVFLICDKNIGLKLPPYFDDYLLKKISEIINKYPLTYICCINGVPNGLILDENMNNVIVPNNGIGGIGGSFIKPFGLANTKKFSELVTCPIIGCGGIRTKQDIEEYLSVGASLVQIGTELMLKGPTIFDELLKD